MINTYRFFLIFLGFAILMSLSFSGCDSAEDIDRLGMEQDYQEPPTDFRQQQSYDTDLQSGQISDMEFEKAVAAYMEIQRLNQDLERKIQNAATSNEIQDLQLEANRRLAETIEENGLDFNTYSNIMTIIKENKDLEERFEKRIRSMLNY